MTVPEPERELTPEEFEREVKHFLETSGGDLSEFSAQHREVLGGADGEYEIDVTVRFEALGAKFLVLVECKRHTSPIKRDAVQVLHDRMRSIGAQKGMLFATNRFQHGAIEYAEVHGIALIMFAPGDTAYRVRHIGGGQPPMPSADDAKYVGWLLSLTPDGDEAFSVIGRTESEALRSFLFGDGVPG